MPRFAVTLRTPDGGYAIIHGSKPMRACICEMELAPYLCDQPLGDRTCDRPIGTNCRTHFPPDSDYCPEHAPVEVEDGGQ